MVSPWKKFLIVLQKYFRKHSYLFTVTKRIGSIALYLKNCTNMDFKKKVFSANIVRSALLLRYTSIQSYKMLLEDYPVSSLSKLIKEKSALLNVHNLWGRMRRYLRMSAYLMKCIYKNMRSILEVNWFVPTRMENL